MLNWIEHLTTDQKVIGSTPIGCAILQIGPFLKGSALYFPLLFQRLHSLFPLLFTTFAPLLSLNESGFESKRVVNDLGFSERSITPRQQFLIDSRKIVNQFPTTTY